MKNYIVYCFTNRLNGKKYFGITNNFHRRLKSHLKENLIFDHALRKYGLKNFRIQILFSNISKEEAQHLEKLLIRIINTHPPNGYNIHTGGKGGNTMAGATKEQHENKSAKISKANTGKKRNNKVKQQMSIDRKGKRTGANNPMYGRTGDKHHSYGITHSTETRHRISQNLPDMSGKNNPMYGKRGEQSPNYGRTFTIEHRKRISQALSGKNNPMYGKKHTTKSRKQMSEAQKRRSKQMKSSPLQLKLF